MYEGGLEVIEIYAFKISAAVSFSSGNVGDTIGYVRRLHVYFKPFQPVKQFQKAASLLKPFQVLFQIVKPRFHQAHRLL